MRIVVDVPAPVEVAFDYFADPVNRPEWQSSLRRVENVAGEIGVGQTWTDVTAPGLRPRMSTVEYDRPRRWCESGRWRGLVVRAELDFAPIGPDACRVTMDVAWSGGLVARMLGNAAGTVGRPALRADLRRAASVLSQRPDAEEAE